MAEVSETSKGLSVDEMKLLSDFSNVVTSREFTKQVKIQKLILTYEETTGFTIQLAETPLASTQPEVVPT